jgi:hypothetical protein
MTEQERKQLLKAISGAIGLAASPLKPEKAAPMVLEAIEMNYWVVRK